MANTNTSRLGAAEQDHKRLYGDFLYVYPVVSRRSRGVSIGINLNPDKVCNFDCVYCEVDRRTPPRVRDIDHAVLESELRAMIGIWKDGSLFGAPPFDTVPGHLRRLNDIAFSGDGEPTTYKRFEDAVDLTARVKRELCPADVKLVLITDAACLDRPGVKRGLTILSENNGEIWAKLDAGTEPYYRLVNRSHVSFERILQNLRDTARAWPIHIQTLLLRVRGEAPSASEITAYCQRLQDIRNVGGKILSVQLYTVARPTPEAWATALPLADLEQIAATIRSTTGLPVDVFPGNA